MVPDAVGATEPERYRLVHGFVSSLGATPVAVDPIAHDRLVALTSHLPHALANLLVNQAGATRIEGHEPLAAAGGSLRDMTRVAGANPRIWVDIFLENAGAIRESLAEHRRRIEQLEARARGAGTPASSRAGSARRPSNRRRMLEGAYPDPGDLQRSCASTCPTARACSPGSRRRSARERINIEDFELHHVSPERGGTLTLLVTGEGEAERAAAAARGAGLRRRRLAGARRDEDRAGRALRGHIAVPGDKSISHRAVLLGAIGDGETVVRGFGRSGDTEATIAAVRALGVTVDEATSTSLRVHGVGLRGLRAPDEPIDCGNAGTLAAAARRDPRRAGGRASS